MADESKDTETQPGSAGGARRARNLTEPAARVRVPEPPSVGMDSIAAAVLVCSADATIVDLNEAAAGLLAVDRAAALGTSLREVRRWPGTWIAESGERIETGASGIARLAFSGCSVSGEVVGLVGPDDGAAPVWLRIAAEPLLSPTGELENVVLTLVDITTLKETRDALEATAAELKELVRTLPDTYLYVDDADVVRRISGARQKGQGVPRALTADGVGETVWSSLPEDAAARMRKAAALTRATGKPVTAEIASVTPTTILYDEVRHVPRDDGNLLLIVRDVTDEPPGRRGAAPERGEVPHAVPAHPGHAALHRRRGPPAQRQRQVAPASGLQRRRSPRASVDAVPDGGVAALRKPGRAAEVLRHRSLRGRPLSDGRQGRLRGRHPALRHLRARRLGQRHPLTGRADRRDRAAQGAARPRRERPDAADPARQRARPGLPLRQRPRLDHAGAQRRLRSGHGLRAPGAPRHVRAHVRRHHPHRGQGSCVGRDPVRPRAPRALDHHLPHPHQRRPDALGLGTRRRDVRRVRRRARP